jgi:hypothetical protein
MGTWQDLIGTILPTLRIGKNKAVLDASGLTAQRTIVLPDAGGSLALAGARSMWVPVSGIVPSLTNGAEFRLVELATNKQCAPVLLFDSVTAEYAQFPLVLGPRYNGGTITFAVHWATTDTGTGGVAWALQALAIGDGGAPDVAWGSAVTVTDSAQSGAYKQLRTVVSGAVTIAGSPNGETLIMARLSRDPANAADNLAADAILIGVEVQYTETY